RGRTLFLQTRGCPVTRTRQIRALDGSIAGASPNQRHSRSGAASFLGLFQRRVTPPAIASRCSPSDTPASCAQPIPSPRPRARQQATITRRQAQRHAQHLEPVSPPPPDQPGPHYFLQSPTRLPAYFIVIAPGPPAMLIFPV